jgi:hypothetical protein
MRISFRCDEAGSMRSSLELPLVIRPLRTAAILVLGALLAPLSATAEVIIDDFDEPVLVASPQSDNEWMTTDNVGPLSATRQVRIGWLDGDGPDGQLDANISMSSVLTGQVSHLNPDSELSRPIVSMQFDYLFSSADLSDGGLNNAIFLDFRRLESAIPPSLLLILVNGKAHLEGPIRRSSNAFTLAIPYTSFSNRGGSPGLPDYSDIRGMQFEIRASAYTGGGPDPLNFMMQLDRIRVGRLVPEPSTFLLSTFAAALLFSIRLRERHSASMRTAMPCCDELIGLHC